MGCHRAPRNASLMGIRISPQRPRKSSPRPTADTRQDRNEAHRRWLLRPSVPRGQPLVRVILAGPCFRRTGEPSADLESSIKQGWHQPAAPRSNHPPWEQTWADGGIAGVRDESACLGELSLLHKRHTKAWRPSA
jgi:hypothetical protein